MTMWERNPPPAWIVGTRGAVRMSLERFRQLRRVTAPADVAQGEMCCVAIGGRLHAARREYVSGLPQFFADPITIISQRT